MFLLFILPPVPRFSQSLLQQAFNSLIKGSLFTIEELPLCFVLPVEVLADLDLVLCGGELISSMLPSCALCPISLVMLLLF
jgi:hypothetical protein